MQCTLKTEQVRRVPERACNGKMMRLKCKINQWHNEQPHFNNYNLLCSKLSQPLSPVAARSYREAHLPCLNILIPSQDGWNSDLHLSNVVCVWHGGGELARRWSPTLSQTQGQILWAYTHDRSHLGLLIRYLLEPSLAVNQSFQPLILTEVSQLRRKDKTGVSWGVETVRWWGDFFTSQLDMFGMTFCAI